MGRQVNFYMSRDDEKDFVEFVLRREGVVLLPHTSTTTKFKPVDILPEPFSGRWWGSFWFYKSKISSDLATKFIPEQEYYVIDDSKASVVEFSRSFLKKEDRVMHRGRIHADFAYLDKEKMIIVPKDPRFEKWYKTIAGWIHRNFDRVDQLIYAGPGAKRLHDKGLQYDIEAMPSQSLLPESQPADRALPP